MKELYWITRLDGIHQFLNSCCSYTTFFLVVFVALLFVFGVISTVVYFGDGTWHEVRVWRMVTKQSFKSVVVTLSILFTFKLIMAFIPTTKEAYMIYGVGGVVDYVKSDTTLVNLPKKVTYALDKWVDEKIETDNKPQEEEKHIEKEE